MTNKEELFKRWAEGFSSDPVDVDDYPAEDIDDNLFFKTSTIEPLSDLEIELRRLAALSEFDFARVCKEAAARLEVTPTDLKKEIKRRRPPPEKAPAPLPPEPEPKPQPAPEYWRQGLLCNDKGDIKDLPNNAMLLLKNHPDWSDRLQRNLASGHVEIDGHKLTEDHLAEFIEWAAKVCRLGIKSHAQTLKAFEAASRYHEYNPITDWLKTLSWDGIARMDTMFADYLGAAQSVYSAACARLLLVAMVARAWQPGCLVRHVVMLEGPEGIGKSRFVRDLGYPWSAEIFSGVESRKDVADDISGVWLAEMMEMDALSRAAASRVKAFITMRNDRYRPSYGHVTVDHPRLTVFVGTVNPSDALSQFRDSDQNTRFLPLVVSGYDAEAFAAVRDLLFAEAVQYWRDHPEDWFELPEEAHETAAELRQARAVRDPWEAIITNWLATWPSDTFTMGDVFDLLVIPTERRSRRESTRIGIILHKLGCERFRRCVDGNWQKLESAYRIMRH